MTGIDLIRQFVSPAKIANDNPSTKPSVNTTALEGQYDFKILLNIHAMNFKGFCDTTQHMLLGLYDAVMLTGA
jgi:hypothetical protein